MTDQVTNIIFAAVDELNADLPPENHIEKSLTSELLGPGHLDSLGLVRLVIAVEQKLNDTLGVTLTLADERAISKTTSPFKTLGTLRDYVLAILTPP